MTQAVVDIRSRRYFETTTEAAKEYGINYSTLRVMLKGRRNNTSGLVYYKDQNNVLDEVNIHFLKRCCTVKLGTNHFFLLIPADECRTFIRR